MVSPHVPHPESTMGHWMGWWVWKLCESYAVAFPVTGSQPSYSFRHLKNQCWDALKLFWCHVMPQGLITTPFAWSIILSEFRRTLITYRDNTEMKTVPPKYMPWFVFFVMMEVVQKVFRSRGCHLSLCVYLQPNSQDKMLEIYVSANHGGGVTGSKAANVFWHW